MLMAGEGEESGWSSEEGLESGGLVERNRNGRREKMENGEDENGERLSVLGLVGDSQNEEGKPSEMGRAREKIGEGL